jgi:hypothetical protein
MPTAAFIDTNILLLSLGWEAEGQRAGFCTETEGSALGLLKLPD